MKSWLTLATLIGLMAPTIAHAQTDDILATGPLLVGCRAFVENDPNGNSMQMGACAGAVSTALQIARAQGKACPPPGSLIIHAARVVVEFSDERAERRSQPFGPMAVSALSDRWHC